MSSSRRPRVVLATACLLIAALVPAPKIGVAGTSSNTLSVSVTVVAPCRASSDPPPSVSCGEAPPAVIAPDTLSQTIVRGAGHGPITLRVVPRGAGEGAWLDILY